VTEGSVGGVIAELLEQINQAQRSGIRSVVTVSVQVKNALSVDGQKTTDGALGKTSSHNNGVVFTISEGLAASWHPTESFGGLSVIVLALVIRRIVTLSLNGLVILSL
jgi:hypothetical protein